MRFTRKFRVTAKSRAGLAPPLPRSAKHPLLPITGGRGCCYQSKCNQTISTFSITTGVRGLSFQSVATAAISSTTSMPDTT
mgnify:CR=1 FL=1